MTARTIPSTMPAAMAMTVSSSVMAMPRKMGAAKRYLPTTPHWNLPSRTPPRVTWEKKRVLTSIAARTTMTTLATQRPGWRTGTILGFGPVPGATAVTAGREQDARWVRSSVGTGPVRAPQLVAPLITDEVTAPDCTPHLVRIWVYTPLAMSALTAACTGAAMPFPLGRARP